MPIELAASVWPFSIAPTPPRTVSAMKPAVLRPSAMTPAQNSAKLMPITGSAKNTRKIWIRSGVPRMKST